jgi:flagellin
MSLNSINTNQASYIALQSLNATSTALEATQKHISTGLRVSDATDDGAAFAIAQTVRSDVGALTTVNSQLGNAKGLVGSTITQLTGVQNQISQKGGLRDTITDLASGNLVGSARAEKIQTYQQQLLSIKGAIQDSAYQGKTLIGNIAGGTGTFGNATLIRNEGGSTYGVATFGGAALLGSLTFSNTQLNSATTAGTLIAAGGIVSSKFDLLGSELNKYGNASNSLDTQITFNTNKIDSLNSGLGYLVDADLAKEAAQLQSLQIKQQLGTQALSIANQAPSSLISLFK